MCAAYAAVDKAPRLPPLTSSQTVSSYNKPPQQSGAAAGLSLGAPSKSTSIQQLFVTGGGEKHENAKMGGHRLADLHPHLPSLTGSGDGDKQPLGVNVNLTNKTSGAGSSNSHSSPEKEAPHSGEASPSGKSGGGQAGRSQAMTPNSAMKQYMNKLSTFEHHEIFNYPQIFFVGQTAKKRTGVIGGADNCSYDDEQGGYIATPHDHIGYRYEVCSLRVKLTLGCGVRH